MMVIQVFADGILLNTLQASATFPHFAYISGKNSTPQSSQKHQICNMVVGNSSKLRTKTDVLNHFELTAYTSTLFKLNYLCEIVLYTEHGPHKFNV